MEQPSAVSSALGAVIGLAEKAFEIRAVDEQARSLLKTADHVAGQLQHAKILRRQKSHLLTRLEKQMFQETFCFTEDAIRGVANLAERARADIDVSGGKVRLGTRILFILRDSPRIHVTLAQLGIASHSLNRDLVMLDNRENHAAQVEQTMFTGPAPPSYDEAMFLTEQRQKNAQRRNSAHPLSAPFAGALTVSLPLELAPNSPKIAELPGDEALFELNVISPLAATTSTLCSFESFSQPVAPTLSFEGATIPQRYRSGRQRSMRWLETQS